MRKIKVSIITPVYNTKPEYLKECIDSVLNQTFDSFEWLFCDDCSKPYIKKIIESYQDPRIVYVRNDKNLGAAESRNRLIDMAKGEYLALLDSDDTMHKDRLLKQVSFLDKNPNVGCLGTWATVNNKKLFDDKKFNSKSLEEHLVFTENVLCNSSVMLRKAVLDKYNIRYKTNFIPAEDYAFYCDLIGLTDFAMLHEVLCDYKHYNTNISNRLPKLQKYKKAFAQYQAIEKYLNLSLFNKDLLVEFSSFNVPKDIDRLLEAIKCILTQLSQFPQYADKLYDTYKNCYRVICYKTFSLSTQFRLLRSPLRKFFNQSIWWQLFCFLTRGLLNFNKKESK